MPLRKIIRNRFMNPLVILISKFIIIGGCCIPLFIPDIASELKKRGSE